MSTTPITSIPTTPIPLVVMATAKAAKKALFKCLAYPSSVYIFPNGKPAHFVNGRFTTDIQSEIDHFENEIRNGHPTITVDENERIVEVFDDPISALRAKIEKEIRDKMAAATNPENDMGKSESGKLAMATSTTIKDMAQGSTSGVALANIKIK